MHTGKEYSLKEFVVWLRRDNLWVLCMVSYPTLLHVLVGWHWLYLPWVPIALVGTAAAFVVGFRNNATYARAWESRQIYGAIVNQSRAWGLLVLDFVRPTASFSSDEAAALRIRLIHRHIAWLTALRYQLRQPRPWETMRNTPDRTLPSKYFSIPEERESLAECLAPLIPEQDMQHSMKCSNCAVQLLTLQGR